MVPPFCDTYSNIGIQVTQVSQGLDFLQELWAPQSFEEHLCCLRFDSMMYFVCVPDSSTLNTYSYMVRSKKSMIPGIFYLHWGGGTGINVGVCVVLHMYIIYIYIHLAVRHRFHRCRPYCFNPQKVKTSRPGMHTARPHSIKPQLLTFFSSFARWAANTTCCAQPA